MRMDQVIAGINDTLKCLSEPSGMFVYLRDMKRLALELVVRGKWHDQATGAFAAIQLAEQREFKSIPHRDEVVRFIRSGQFKRPTV